MADLLFKDSKVEEKVREGNIKETLIKLQEGLTMALENDLVIFKALRTHEINGESEEQEEKMKKYFIGLLQ